jgi:hypothetical protein
VARSRLPNGGVFVETFASASRHPERCATTAIASNGGPTLKTTGAIAGAVETFDAAFVSSSTGWVLDHNTSGAWVIVATTDGGYHWSQQFAIAP